MNGRYVAAGPPSARPIKLVRRKYDVEFKQWALTMVRHEQSFRLVAKALDIGENSLHRYNRSALGYQSAEDFERAYY
jgi:transposase-like protein